MQVIFVPTSICVLHSNFCYLHINSLLEWRFYYFHMFRNPVNQFMQLNPFPAVKTFTWTGAERHAWRNRYWRSRGQIVYRRNHRNGVRLLQRTLKWHGVVFFPKWQAYLKHMPSCTCQHCTCPLQILELHIRDNLDSMQQKEKIRTAELWL